MDSHYEELPFGIEVLLPKDETRVALVVHYIRRQPVIMVMILMMVLLT